MKKFKIEYRPAYYSKYEIHRYDGWWQGWKEISAFATEEEALEALKNIVSFPKYFDGDNIDGIIGLYK